MSHIEPWQSTYLIMFMWFATSFIVYMSTDTILKRLKWLEERLIDSQVIRK